MVEGAQHWLVGEITGGDFLILRWADRGSRRAPSVCFSGCQGLLHGKGAKVGLYKKCAADLGLKMTGLEANLLSIIDNLVNGEYYLPPGDKEELYALVREVASGYTIVGTTVSVK
jgi:hypothetical protein